MGLYALSQGGFGVEVLDIKKIITLMAFKTCNGTRGGTRAHY
jgi:hypothetical protein